MSIDIAAIAAAVTPAVVGVGSGGRRGSGTVVAPGTVVTTAHNVPRRQDGAVTVRFSDGRRLEGSLSATSEDLDLAVIAVDTGDIGPLSWGAADAVAVGVDVVAAAAPDGVVRLTAGTVATATSRLHTRTGSPVDRIFEHTATLIRGASGGPVLDSQGALIGIDTNRLEGGLYQAALADADMRSLVDQLGRGEVPPRPRLGVSVAHRRQAQHLREAVGLPPLDAVLITGAEEGGPAATAGLGRGDLVTALNGHALRG
ncbi:MAG TPA: S1C family serine protease, partial [Euzebya sp.]|nr:S1C family serine protease [Euzebya sp.]